VAPLGRPPRGGGAGGGNAPKNHARLAFIVELAATAAQPKRDELHGAHHEARLRAQPTTLLSAS